MADYVRVTSLSQQQPYRNHGNSYSSLIFVFLLCSCGTAIVLIPLLTLSTDPQFKTHVILAAQSIGLLYEILIIAICLGFIWKYKSWISYGMVRHHEHREPDSHTHLLRSLPNPDSTISNTTIPDSNYSSSFPVVFFGIGSILYLIVHMVMQGLEFSTCTDSYVQITNSIALVICCALYIAFLHKFKDATLKNCPLFHYSLALIIGADVCLWVYITIHPLWIVSSTTSNTTIPLFDFDNTSTDRFNQMFIGNMVEAWLQPFLVEFLFISLGYYLALWQTMREDGLSDLVPHNQEESWGMEDDTPASMASDQERQAQTTWFHRHYKLIAIIFSATTVLFYFTSFVILVMGPFSGLFTIGLPILTQNMIMKCIQMISATILIVLSILSLRKIRTSAKNIPKVKHITTEGYLLLLTTAAVFVYTLLKLIAAFKFPVEKSIFYIAFQISCIVRYWYQAQLIITAHYVHRSTGTLPKIVQIALIYVVAINIGGWAWISVMHKWMEDAVLLQVYDPILVRAFGEVTAKKTHLILDPMREMCAFHSAAVAYATQKVRKAVRE